MQDKHSGVENKESEGTSSDLLRDELFYHPKYKHKASFLQNKAEEKELIKYLHELFGEDERDLSPNTFHDLVKDSGLLWKALIDNGYVAEEKEEHDEPGDKDEYGEPTITGTVSILLPRITSKFNKIQNHNELILPYEYDNKKYEIYSRLKPYTVRPLREYKKQVIALLKKRIYARFGNTEYVKNIFSELSKNNSVKNTLTPHRAWQNKYSDPKGREELVDELINDIYYDAARDQVTSWIKRAKKCDALIIHAPLGLGKTTAIAKALNDENNKDKSAIIFMPRTELCKDLFEKFDKKDCCLIEGVTEKNCRHYNDIIRNYYEFRFSKYDICKLCEDTYGCRIKEQAWKAKEYRIIIATYAQYPKFINSPEDLKWESELNGKKVRDFLVIDENIFVNQFMKTITISETEFKRDVGLLAGSHLRFKHNLKEKLKLIVRKVGKSDVSTIISPIDRKFEIPEKDEDAKNWDKIIEKAEDKDKIVVRNLRQFYCSAIKYGLVVRVFQSSREHGGMSRYLYLLNPAIYDLKKKDSNTKEKIIPTHIFFDASEVRKDVFMHYYPGARKKEIEIDVKPLGSLEPTKIEEDLSKTSFNKSRAKQNNTKAYLKKIISQHGNKAK